MVRSMRVLPEKRFSQRGHGGVKCLLVFLSLFWATLSSKAAEHPVEVPAGLLRMGDGLLFPPFALVVDKSKKKIHVVDNSTGQPSVIETYDSDLGKMAGDKHSTGDSRTPEGIYFLEQVLEGSALDAYKYGAKAFVTNYPNFFDHRDGKSGFGIWLHAIDDSVTLERGSKGCVVVRNNTIEKISHYITLNETPLMIFDKVQWQSPEIAKKDASDFLNLLGEWKKAWESKDINSYIGFYASDFKFGKMNLSTFKKYKQELAEKYKDIKISLSMPVIFAHNNKVIARFFQDYSSSDHADFGEKTLYLTKQNGVFKIINEDWREANDPKSKSFLAGSKLCCQTSN